MENLRVKTYKREVALASAAVLVLFMVGSVWSDNAFRVVDAIVYPVFGFLGIAFGLDAASKQFGGKQ